MSSMLDHFKTVFVLAISDDAMIGMGAVVIADVPAGMTIAAIPARRFPSTDQ